MHTYYSAGCSVTREIPNFNYMLLVYFIDFIVLSF